MNNTKENNKVPVIEALDLDGLKESARLIVTGLWFRVPTGSAVPSGWCIPPSDEPRVRAILDALPGLIAAAEERDRLREPHIHHGECACFDKEYDHLRSRDRLLTEIEKMADPDDPDFLRALKVIDLLAEARRRADRLASGGTVGADE